MLSGLKDTVARQLYDAGALNLGEFRHEIHETHPDVPVAPYYFSLAVVQSSPALMEAVTDLYIKMMEGLSYDLVAAVPTVAPPIAAVICYRIKAPMVTPRLAPRDHGVTTNVEGTFKAGQVALVVDYVMSNPAKNLAVIDKLKSEGLEVRDVIGLVDNEGGVVPELERRGYRCRSAFKISDLFRHYVDLGLMSESDYQRCLDYLRMEQRFKL